MRKYHNEYNRMSSEFGMEGQSLTAWGISGFGAFISDIGMGDSDGGSF